MEGRSKEARHAARRLLPQILIRVLPACILVLLGIWYAASEMVQTTVRNELNSRLAQQAGHGADEASQKLGLLKDAVKALSENSLIINSLIDSVGRDVYLATMFQSLRLPGPPSARVSLTDYKGRPLASNKDPMSYQGAEWVSEVLQGFTLFRMDRNGLMMAVPVRYAGSPEGAIVYELGYRDLMSLIVPKDQGFTNALLSGSGRVLHSSDAAFAIVGEPLAKSEDSIWAMGNARLPSSPISRWFRGS